MLRFEDKDGDEEIFVQAEKDMNITVKNNRTTTIHVDDTETVETGNHSLTVSQGNRSAEISVGNDSLTVDLGNITHEATVGSYKITALGGITITCGASTIEMTPASITITSAMINLNP